MMKIVKWKDLPHLFKRAFKVFLSNDPLRLGAATAFFTIFALPPIILIITSVFGFIYSEQIISGQLYNSLKKIIGSKSASQVYAILQNIHELDKSWLITVLGFVFLIFVSTTLFKVIQNSLNQLWKIKLKHKSNFKRVLQGRLISFLIIIFGGILFLASLLLDSTIAYSKDYLVEVIPSVDSLLIQVARRLVTFIVLTVWFGTIFKFLSDAQVSWKAVSVSSVLTAILFTVGEVILGKLLVNSGLDNIYGAAGAVVLVLLFVFYSSFIFYYGASFVKCYSDYLGKKISPKSYATSYKIKEI